MLKLIEGIFAEKNGIPINVLVEIIPDFVKVIVLRVGAGRTGNLFSEGKDSVRLLTISIDSNRGGIFDVERFSIDALTAIYGNYNSFCALPYLELDAFLIRTTQVPTEIVRNVLKFLPKLASLVSRDSLGNFFNHKEISENAAFILNYVRYVEEDDVTNLVKVIPRTCYSFAFVTT